jgi:hypothetical protein
MSGVLPGSFHAPREFRLSCHWLLHCMVGNRHEAAVFRYLLSRRLQSLKRAFGWNEGEFEMFGVAQRDHEKRYAFAQEWISRHNRQRCSNAGVPDGRTINCARCSAKYVRPHAKGQ